MKKNIEFKNAEKIFLFILIMTISIYIYLINPYKNTKLFFTPDEYSFFFYSQKILKNNFFLNENILNNKYSTTAFSPYFSSYSDKGDLLKDHFGYVIFLSLLSLFIKITNIPVIITIFNLFCFFLISVSFLKKSISFVSLLIFSLFPVFLHFYPLLFSDNLGLIFFCLWFYSTRKIEYSNWKIMSIIFSSFLTLIRYVNVIFLIFTILILIYKKNIRILLTIFPLIIIFMLFPIILINIIYYGNPFVYPQFENSKSVLDINKYPYKKYDIQSNINKSSFLSYIKEYFDINSILLSFKYLIFFSPLAPLSIIGIFLLIKELFIFGDKITISIMILLLIYMIFMFSIKDIFRVSNVPSLHDSLSRYLIPVFSFIIILISKSLYYKKNSQYLVSILIFLIITISILNLYNVTIEDPLNYIVIKEKIMYYQKIHDKVISNTENNSIIITSVWEKIIYPERNVLVYIRIPEEIRLDEINRIVKELKNDSYDVYILVTNTELKYYKDTSDKKIKFYDVINNLNDKFKTEMILSDNDLDLIKIGELK
ncbi:MAG: hypothetical protein N3D75_03805 [Candidatus Aenigmarchaeota archaeon]|nr:hypothetical protein [Candidatus Aenigmarchaeota archaeon]